MEFSKEELEKIHSLLTKNIPTKRIATLVKTTEWQIRKIKNGIEEAADKAIEARPAKEIFEEIKLDVEKPTLKVVKVKGKKTAVVASDIHFPFEDKDAVNIFLDIVEDMQPDYIVLLGDIADIYELSSYTKNPLREHTLKFELEATKKFFAKLRETCKSSHIFFLKGNHTQRIEKYLAARAPELATLEELKVQNILELKKYNIEYVHGDLKIGDLVYIHGVKIGSYAGSTAKKNLDSMGISVICGHVHRCAVINKTTWEKCYTSIENGTLASMSQEYLGGQVPDWQQGFTVINYLDNDFWAEVVQIKNKKTLFRGKVFGA